MNVAFSADSFGRIVCDIGDATQCAIVTSSDAAGAALGLLSALDEAEKAGCGECVWPEGGGQYWWILRRDAGRLTCVLLWSRGTLTGWQQLLRTDTAFEEFAQCIREGLEKFALTDSRSS